MTFLKMTNMTVAIMVAAIMRSAWANVQTEIAKDHHLLLMTMGVMKIETKVMQIPVKKKANMT